MSSPSPDEIRAVIARLSACRMKDWRLDEIVNNITGQVRKITCIGLNGAGKRTRYYGPNADPHGRGSPVPSPTLSAENRARAIKALRKIMENDA